MHLYHQKEYYDTQEPVLILVPIYELDDVLNWNGKDEYNVMAMMLKEKITTKEYWKPPIDMFIKWRGESHHIT